MKVTTKKWDASEHLDSPEMIKEYINEAIKDGDPAMLRVALGTVAKAQGMTEIAKKANINRQNLYKAFDIDRNPKIETIEKVVKAFGLKLTVEIA
jgi:probable addiction module antidote protein